jgi:hypothetical protein
VGVQKKNNLNKVSLIVKVHPNLAYALHRRQASKTKLKELLNLEKDLGIVLKPVHPGSKDPYLAPYFGVQVTDRATAERIIDRLQNCKAVEAAYFKPSEELPADNSIFNDTLGALP